MTEKDPRNKNKATNRWLKHIFTTFGVSNCQSNVKPYHPLVTELQVDVRGGGAANFRRMGTKPNLN